MELIDDGGRILGIVNIIDALVVLLVLAVVVAGYALVTTSGQDQSGPNTTVRYATLDIGTQPTYIAKEITLGDTVEPDTNSNLTITDRYSTSNGNGKRLFVRVRLQGVTNEESIMYDGGPPRLGRELTIQTPTYEVAGKIVSVSRTDETLPLRKVPVLIEATLRSEAAGRLETGDANRNGDLAVAQIRDVLYYETENPNEQRAIILTSLVAYESQVGLQFGGTPVRTGETVQLSTANLGFSGRIIQKELDQMPTSKTDVLLRVNASTETVNRIDEGDTYNISGQPVGTVEAVEAFGTGDPDRKLAFVGVEYRTYHPREEPQFAGEVVREGATVPFATNSYQFKGRVMRMNTVKVPGRETTRTVRIKLEGAEPSVAQSYRPGMEEVVQGKTIARIKAVEVEPTQMVLTSQDGKVFLRDHPIKRDVTVTAEIRVRQTPSAIRFKGQTLRRGDTVTLDLGTVTLRGTVTSFVI